MLRRTGQEVRESFIDNPLRKSAEKIVATTLSGWKLWLFQKILKWARKRVQGRENLRFERTRVFARVREVFRAIAVQFAAENIIKEEKDIFYLEVQEIFGWIQGTATTVNLKGLIELRKTEYAVWEKEGKPADRFYTYGSIWLHNQFIGKGLPPKDGEIRGTPACPGTVRGRVRCIVDPTKENMEPGEIMVCYRTDPGWAPLFPNASAILVERGSLLSHSAVVARELGIPTIVAIPNLMESLKTGDEITVFANDGRVEVHKENQGEENG
jgi:pyruvate,water dikinase